MLAGGVVLGAADGGAACAPYSVLRVRAAYSRSGGCSVLYSVSYNILYYTCCEGSHHASSIQLTCVMARH